MDHDKVREMSNVSRVLNPPVNEVIHDLAGQVFFSHVVDGVEGEREGISDCLKENRVVHQCKLHILKLEQE